MAGELFNCDCTRVSVNAVAHCNLVLFHFTITDDQHKRYASQLGISNLCADLFAAQISLDSETLFAQIVSHLFSIVELAICDRQYYCLHRSKPNREFSFEMLDQNPKEPLHRAKQSPMDHDRLVRLSILANIFQLK